MVPSSMQVIQDRSTGQHSLVHCNPELIIYGAIPETVAHCNLIYSMVCRADVDPVCVTGKGGVK